MNFNVSTPIKLSKRESDCLDLIKKRYSINQIAIELGIRPKTVSTYLSRIKEKLNLPNLKKIKEEVVNYHYKKW